MLYLNEHDILKIGMNWNKTIDIIKNAVVCISNNDFTQPVKPYLRYRDLINRIIAMPAFIGGDIDLAGIKWIASFPKNIDNGIQRAHSIIILNNIDTGQPISVINSALLSTIRTCSVSGLMIRYFLNARPMNKINIGIIGWGPIGQYHYKMTTDIINNKIEKIFLYDIRRVELDSIDSLYKDKIIITNNWQEAYENTDIFITCTVSKTPYIDEKPKEGSLQLNCSLRDYKVDIYDYIKAIIVDDWEECCREKTDIERMHFEKGLQKKDTKSIADVVTNNCLNKYSPKEPIMFNPMGMGIFDIAISGYYLNAAKRMGLGHELK